eukprot:m.304224 g.304224  ORF g.304224 m.304224 type:complete len:341 (+) comp16337_c0_seq16:131-1153(+)
MRDSGTDSSYSSHRLSSSCPCASSLQWSLTRCVVHDIVCCWTPQANHCKFRFCSGACPFRPNISTAGVENLTVYRLTPWNVRDLGQHDTGDAAGDLGFTLLKYTENSNCTPPYNTEECFLDDYPIVGEFNVLFDGNYGPYLHCNPTPIAGSNGLVDLQNFTCLYTAPTYPNPWSPSHGQGCSPPCDRVNVTVGKDPAHHVWPGTKAAKSVMSSYFGGYWYSTTKRSECTGTRLPGDGKTPTCSWKLVDNPRFVNATCLAGVLFGELKAINPGCFTACGPAAGRGNPCFTQCVKSTVLGTPGMNNGVSVPRMVAAWESAFTGKCPILPPLHSSISPNVLDI